MTKKELIDHLQHLEKYTHYSEDAPALREVIEMLKCSEMPNGSEERTQKRTRTHACDLIDRREAIEAIKNLPRWVMDANGEFQPVDSSTVSMLDPEDAVSAIENLPSAQPDCVDCKKHYYIFGCDLAGEYLHGRLDDDFCSHAERREE
jgi:hypothetical protein